jgi:hypothetical protein
MDCRFGWARRAGRSCLTEQHRSLSEKFHFDEIAPFESNMSLKDQVFYTVFP